MVLFFGAHCNFLGWVHLLGEFLNQKDAAAEFFWQSGPVAYWVSWLPTSPDSGAGCSDSRVSLLPDSILIQAGVQSAQLSLSELESSVNTGVLVAITPGKIIWDPAYKYSGSPGEWEQFYMT